ncbi:hypothetical protein [Clostridium botulinum]|uniref:hypothetical protein n=1 Tax=Clostridium botulinum TaxID=1491 RepID=UPI0006AC8F21|nr:hypothetical protein [Clostridium botulinum]KOR55291.1 hypothetical protein ADT22_16900 [Clostridium botulinum]
MKGNFHVQCEGGEKAEITSKLYLFLYNRLGQTVCGAKYKGKIVKPPVADIYPQILETEKEKDKIEYHCSQIEEHPQNFVVNVISATVTFTMINNIVSLGKVKKSIVKFNADNISVE